MNRAIRMVCFGLILLYLSGTTCISSQKTSLESADAVNIEQLKLPEDTSAGLTVKKLQISGNSLISTDELLNNLPPVYNASNKPLEQAEPGDLYDFRILHDIIRQPDLERKVSRRTMQGLTQYILSVYHEHRYAGIYVYISAQAVDGEAKLKDGVLPIEVVEAKVSEITVTAYDVDRKKKEPGLLRSSVVEDWSPVRPGQLVDKKKLDDFVNLLNLNPDRYISAVISRGSEPDTLALGYEIYEANPWHYYIQLDDAGTEQRQWAPRIGVVNTNLTGIDDRFSAMYQSPWESGIEDNYAMYGSYEFPVFSPRLRLNLYAGRSEFDTSSGGGIDFLGKGCFYGGVLRYNILQRKGWFLDLTNSLSRENSKVTSSFSEALETDIDMNLWALGFDLYRSSEMSDTSFSFSRTQNVGGSDKADFEKARTGTNSDFNIYTISAGHSRYLDAKKINRLSGSLRRITSNHRLAPSKMSVFGGLYSVRGYKEDEIVSDGGLLVSAQYEFDLVKHEKSRQSDEKESEQASGKNWLKKLALLAFTDLARAKTIDPVAGEQGTQELASVGLGVALAGGDNFDANIYYGWPLRSTVDTNKGEGRWSFSFIRRW